MLLSLPPTQAPTLRSLSHPVLSHAYWVLTSEIDSVAAKCAWRHTNTPRPDMFLISSDVWLVIIYLWHMAGKVKLSPSSIKQHSMKMYGTMKTHLRDFGGGEWVSFIFRPPPPRGKMARVFNRQDVRKPQSRSKRGCENSCPSQESKSSRKTPTSYCTDLPSIYRRVTPMPLVSNIAPCVLCCHLWTVHV
jgi:hypothetical protein